MDFLELQMTPAADVKIKGWPSLMRKVRAEGAVVVTNHNHPEAVVVDAQAYRELLAQANATNAAASRAQSLKALQARFDEHLAALNTGDGLAKALARPARRRVKVVLGEPR